MVRFPVCATPIRFPPPGMSYIPTITILPANSSFRVTVFTLLSIKLQRATRTAFKIVAAYVLSKITKTTRPFSVSR